MNTLDKNTTAPLPATKPKRVLIADDNQDAAVSLSMLMEMQGHTVFVAFGGEQALALAEKERPDVLVLDIGMPELDGYAVARRIRQCSWGRRIKLIAATGYGQKEDVERARRAGFDHHLLKPMDPEAIDRVMIDSGSEE